MIKKVAKAKRSNIKTPVKKVAAKAKSVKKSNLKLGDDGYEAQFIGVVTEAIMDVVDRKMDDINTRLHLTLEKIFDDFWSLEAKRLSIYLVRS